MKQKKPSNVPLKEDGSVKLATERNMPHGIKLYSQIIDYQKNNY